MLILPSPAIRMCHTVHLSPTRIKTVRYSPHLVCIPIISARFEPQPSLTNNVLNKSNLGWSMREPKLRLTSDSRSLSLCVLLTVITLLLLPSFPHYQGPSALVTSNSWADFAFRHELPCLTSDIYRQLFTLHVKNFILLLRFSAFSFHWLPGS